MKNILKNLDIFLKGGFDKYEYNLNTETESFE